MSEARKKWDTERFKVDWSADEEREPGNDDDPDEWEFVKVGDERPAHDEKREPPATNDEAPF